MSEDRDRVMKILQGNAGKSFVKRVLEPDKYPVLQNPDGSVSTHLMAWTQTDDDKGRKHYIVYPTVLFDGKELKNYGPEAFHQAMKSGNFIDFDTPEEADWFSRNYKLAWEGKKLPWDKE